MSLDLGKQFKSLLEPERMEEGFVDQVLQLKIHRFTSGEEDVEELILGPLPRWFTLYEVKLTLWNKKERNPAFSPAVVFMGLRESADEDKGTAVSPLPSEAPLSPEAPLSSAASVSEVSEGQPTSSVVRGALGFPQKKKTVLKLPAKKGGANMYTPIEILWKTDSFFSLVSPELRMTGPPDERFVDSTGSQKSVGKTNRIRMTLSDIFAVSYTHLTLPTKRIV